MVQLLAWRGRWTDPVDVAIMLATWSPYSHVGWVLDDLVVEVVRSGSRNLYLSGYEKRYDLFDLSIGSLGPALEDRVEQRALGRRVPYDFWAIAGVTLRLATGCRFRKLQSDGRETCAEALSRDLEAVGLPIPRHPEFMTPADLVGLSYLRRVKTLYP